MMNRFLTAACAATMVFAAGCGSSGSSGSFLSGKLIVADGKEGVNGSIYTIDPETGEIGDEVGTLPRGLTAMVAAPDGTIYGVTSYLTTDTDGEGNLRLYRFVPDNATQTLEAELVGDLDEIAEENETDAPGYVIAGLVYIDGTLYGHETDVTDPAFYSIDPETGIMEELGIAEGYNSYGAGIATDSDGTIYGALHGLLVTFDPDDGSVVEEIAEWENNTDEGYYITDLTFVEGRLLGLVVYETAEDTILVEIDPETGETEEIGVLPGDIAAITYVP